MMKRKRQYLRLAGKSSEQRVVLYYIKASRIKYLLAINLLS